MEASRILLQSLDCRPMMPTGMEHIYQQHPTGYSCAVCGGLATTERGTNHLWAAPATETKQPASTTRRSIPVSEPATPVVVDTVPVVPATPDSLAGLRQDLVGLGTTDDDTSRTLRDMFDAVDRVGIDVR